MGTIAVDPGFEGSAPTWFYLDRTNGTLGRAFPAGRTLSTSAKPKVTFTPRFLNAPSPFEGQTNQTKFRGNGKPTAYLKVQLIQDTADENASKPLTWAALYPIIDNSNDDIGGPNGMVIFSTGGTAVSGDPVVNVPLPGGSATLNVTLTAIVGGAKKSSLANIIDKVLGVAGSTSGKALFPIPQADIALAGNIESLLNFASTSFAPETKQQFWFANSDEPVRVTGAVANDGSLLLPQGSVNLVATQPGDNNSIVSQIDTIAATAGNTFELDSNGGLIARNNGAVVNPNPFKSFIYATFTATVR